jgi:hypothetical protein
MENIMTMYTTEKGHRRSNNRCLADADIEDVCGGVASVPAYIHHVFGGSASDLLFGSKGLIADVIYDTVMGRR